MKKFYVGLLGILPIAIAFGQSPSSTPSGEMESLRQQVQSLTETVKTLQQQMQQQQATIDRMNQENAPANAEPSPIAGATVAPSASPAGNTAGQFPTEDTSVVATTTTTAPAASPAASAGAFPTTDTSVVAAPPETISTTGAGAALTQPITIGGSRNYMNISFDGLFALA